MNQYLWALDFGNGGTGFSSTSLYFTAGVNNQTGGLFGSIAAVATPEPATLPIAAVGLLSILLVGLRKETRTKTGRPRHT